MKAKDIVVGQDYAVGFKGGEQRATVLEKGVERRVISDSSPWSNGHLRNDGIKIRFVDRTDGGSVREKVEPASRFRRTWAEHEPVIAAHRSAVEQRKAREQRMEKLAARLTAAGIKAKQTYSAGIAFGTGRYLLEIEDLDAIERVLDAGRAGNRFIWQEGDIEIQKEGTT